jgi:hypothetical protein
MNQTPIKPIVFNSRLLKVIDLNKLKDEDQCKRPRNHYNLASYG